ncbi:MAG: rRNA maturation RNase YbeY [Proteobacteria bacterium]|nr:rRNA maturation RNase YbeY [Pseudomonadota bacterium]
MEEKEPQEIEGLHYIVNETEYEVPMRALKDRIDRLYAHIGEESSEVNVVLTSDDEIHRLNKEWRDVDESTDVLSFPMREDEDPEIAAQLPLGDIVISLDTAMRYVESCHHKDRLCELGALPLTENWSLLDELTFLAIHSTLHLLGHDHAEPEEEKVMREKEREWMLYILESEGK